MHEFDPATAPEAEQVSILVVDDDPLVRFLIGEALRDLDITVVEAASADEAWDYLGTGARVDLVFSDHRMPGSMSGLQLVTKIRKTYPRLEAVLTSGDFDWTGWPEPVLRKPYAVLDVAADLAMRAADGDKR